MRAPLLALLLVTLALGCDDAAPPSEDAGRGADATTSADAGALDAADPELTCSATFGPDEACGGDPVAEWTYLDVCGVPKSITDFLANCAEAQLVHNNHTITGTAGWAIDGTFGWSLHDDFDVFVQVPVACAVDYGGCAGFALLASIGTGQSITCIERDQRCECSSIGATEDRAQGIYTVMSGTITATLSSGKRRSYYYCQRGDRLMFRRTDDGIVFLLERAAP
ncbi:MAG: hypothetical protein IT384_23885 [Deltaproteobacteria bacterium]|nr:hypothetical protein [Deltaproteobacteria bacterium]